MSKILSFLLLAFVFVGYQNCGKQMKFMSNKDTDSIVRDGEIEVIEDPGIIDDVIADENPSTDTDGSNGSSGSNGTDSANGDEGSNGSNGSNDNDDDNSNGNGGTNGNDGSNGSTGSNGADNSNGSDGVIDRSESQYICILEGKGKSLRLGYSNSELVSVGSTPQAVCTTQRGCLEIARQKFNVVSAEYRGFCKNDSAQSIQLTESELEALINK